MNEQETPTLVELLKQFLQAGDTLAEASLKVRGQIPNLTAMSLAPALAEVLNVSGKVEDESLNGAIQIAGALEAAGYTLDQIAPAMIAPGVYPGLTASQLGQVLIAPSVFPDTTKVQMREALVAAASFAQSDIDSAMALLYPSPPITTGIVESSSLAVSFSSMWVSAGRPVTFLDPLTSINLALSSDGNGNWKGTISCPYPNTQSYSNAPITVGATWQIGTIHGISYSVAFSNDGGQQIFMAIRATITGIQPQQSGQNSQ